MNGKPWTDLNKPFEPGITPDPVETRFACEGRGTSGLTRSEAGITIMVCDEPGAAGRYMITLFRPSGK